MGVNPWVLLEVTRSVSLWGNALPKVAYLLLQGCESTIGRWIPTHVGLKILQVGHQGCYLLAAGMQVSRDINAQGLVNHQGCTLLGLGSYYLGHNSFLAQGKKIFEYQACGYHGLSLQGCDYLGGEFQVGLILGVDFQVVSNLAPEMYITK